MAEAIDVANGTARDGCETSSDDADTITITAAGTSAGTISLSAALPEISTTITINGGGYTIDANGTSSNNRRVFKVTSTGDLTVNNMILEDGNQGGAAIFVDGGSLALSNVTLTNNYADANGGAIYVTNGNLTASNVSLNNNSARYGGAIFAYASSISLKSVSLDNNSSTAGGAIRVQECDVTLDDVSMIGNATSGYGADYGGAILVGLDSTLTIRDSTLSDNTAVYDGGAIFAADTSTISITGSTFNNNSTTGSNKNGGAIELEEAGSVTIVNSAFYSNSSTGEGGAVYAEGSSLTLRGVALNNNEAAGDGGAISAEDSSDVILYDVTITNSSTDSEGGAIAIDGGSLTASGGSISGATSGGPGGAVWFDGGDHSFSNMTMSDNMSEEHGGAIYVFGGSVSLIGVTMNNNEAADDGGAIMISQADSATIANSTITSNSSTGDGGGIGADNSNVTLTHVTMVDNSSGSGTGDGFYAASGSTTHIVNSIIYGGSDACSGTLTTDVGNLIGSGNCSATALTDDPILGGLTGSPAYFPLLPGSPAIDSASAADCLEVDQTGAIRAGKGSNCDIGAYEYFVRQPMAERSTPTPLQRPAVFSTCLASHSQLPASIVISGVTSPSAQCQHIGAEGVGQPAVLARGLIDAVDVWSYLAGGLEVCFRHSGEIIFLDGAASPRSPGPVSAYSTAGMSCAWIDRPGTVVLVTGSSPPPKAAAAPPSTSLSGCMVTTTDMLNFRSSPGGEVMSVLPYDVTLTALARTADWFQVDYHGAVGWISAGYVIADGSCG